MAKRKAKEPTAAQIARRAQRERLAAHRAQRKLDAVARAEHRKNAREKLAGLRKKLGEALSTKKIRLKALLETIREQRAELRIELKATRKRILEGLKDKLREEHAAARVRYLTQKDEARRTANSDVARARASLAVERQHQAEEKRIKRDAHARHSEHAKAMAHPEFDNVVRAKAILGGFGTLYERVKDTLRPPPGQTRAEAFLDYAQSNPEELHASLDPKAEAAIEKTKAEIAEVEKSLNKPQPHHLAHAARKVRERAAARPPLHAVKPSPPSKAAEPKRRKVHLQKAKGILLEDLVRERDQVQAAHAKRPPRKAKRSALASSSHAANSNHVAPNVVPTASKAHGDRGRAVHPGKRTETTVKAPEVRDHAVLAKMIKNDIKDAVKAGKLPKKAVYSVRSEHNSIRVRASSLPFPVTNPDAFFVEPGANFMSYDSSRFTSRETPEAQAVRKKLNAIVDAYHWDKSDLQSDYFHSRFYKSVDLVEDAAAYRALEAAKIAASRGHGGRDGRRP